MPIEIKELHISVAVEPPAPTATPAGTTASTPAATADREALVAACVEQVLEILDKKRDR